MADMEDDFLLSDRIAILGLGLMGGSLAMALRDKCAWIYGVDPDPDARAIARTKGLFDHLTEIPDERLSEANIVILAAPARAIIALLEQLPGLHPGTPLVMDLGSTKAEIVRAMAKLPARFDPIGGHPMCGKEVSTLENAEADLFQGQTFALTPLERTSEEGKAFAEELVCSIGANPLWIDPQTHDRWVGATSHLPYLISSSLAAATPPDAGPLVGSGFRSTTRLSASSVKMMVDILLTNQENVLAGIRGFQDHLDKLAKYLSNEDQEALFDALAQGAESYQNLVG